MSVTACQYAIGKCDIDRIGAIDKITAEDRRIVGGEIAGAIGPDVAPGRALAAGIGASPRIDDVGPLLVARPEHVILRAP